MRALIGGQRQAFAVRQLPDVDFDHGAHDAFSTVLAMRATSSVATCSLVITGQELTLDLAPSRVKQMNRVAVAAHHAGRGRDVIGDDPVAALARKFCLGVVDQIFRLGSKADHQRRAPVPQL